MIFCKTIKKIYIFDTSAIRQFSIENVKKISTESILHISLYTFYEMICHIKNENEFIDFKNKHLAKFQYSKILQDPYFVFKKAIIPNDINEKTYGSDHGRTFAVCLALEKSKTLNDFHNAKIKELNGVVRSCKDISINFETELKKRENNFINYANEIFNVLKKRSSDNFSDFENIYSLLYAEFKDKEIDKNEECKIINQGFLYYSYIYFWICEYLKKNGLTQIPIGKKTRNSYEDSLLFMNLLLTVEITLVTTDKELLKIANNVFDFVNKNKEKFAKEFNLKIKKSLIIDQINNS